VDTATRSRLNKQGYQSVIWVRRHRRTLSDLGFFEDLQAETARYIDEHELCVRGAGHAAINNVGRNYYPLLRMNLIGKEHNDTTLKVFLAHLRRWFDCEGVNELTEALIGEAEE
jgi:hypothetical protein